MQAKKDSILFFTKNEILKLIKPIEEKYNILKTLESKNKFLHNFKNSQEITNLINFIKDDELVNKSLINFQINEANKKDYFKNLQYIFDYIEIIEKKPIFTAGVFLLPKGHRIPLHNHPNMIVLTKCLFGSIEIRNYDRAFDPQISDGFGSFENSDFIKSNIDSKEKKAISPMNLDGLTDKEKSLNFFEVKKKENLILKDNDISILTPYDNNIHTIYAYEDSAFFDIIFPAYDNEENRECNYYEIVEKNRNYKGKKEEMGDNFVDKVLYMYKL